MFLDRFHMLRIAGVNTILGLDLNEDRAHLVEISFSSAAIGRQKGKYGVRNAISVGFLADESESERVAKMRKALLSSKIKTRYVASSINTVGVRVVTTDVPPSIEDVGEWIEENIEGILKLPIPLSELTISHEILRASGSARKARIAFVRRNEVETHLQTIEALGLDSIHLSAGIQDLLYLPLLDPKISAATKVVHLRNGATTAYSLSDGVEERLHHGAMNVAGSPAITDHLGGNMPLVGDLPQNRMPGDELILGIDCKYALALCCAVGAIARTSATIDLLPRDCHCTLESRLYSFVFKRAVVTAGLTILALLAVPFLTSSYLTGRIEELDEDESALLFNQVEMLEEEMSLLEGRILGDEGILNRTSVASVMQELASALPESLWLGKLEIEAETTHFAMVNTEGLALSNDHISRFLRALTENPKTDRARLIRSGEKEENGSREKQSSKGATEFEIVARMRM